VTVSDEPTPSFEAIASELGPALRHYLRKMVGNAADADDLLQDSLMRIARALPKFEHRSSIKSWAYRITTNAAIDHLRRKKRATFFEFIETSDSDGAESLDDSDRLVIGEMNACIREVIDGLPPDYRAALVLFNLEGKTVAEVAAICRISLSLAKVRIHRGKARLKKALERECVFYESSDGALRCDRKFPQTLKITSNDGEDC
jgi:RNA polymerase sigma-70 factor (ECF subfamily)